MVAKITFETFISCMEISAGKRLIEFSEWFKKCHPEQLEIIEKHKNAIAVISGSGFDVRWSEPHECDCEYCECTGEKESKFFTKKEDAEKQVSNLKKYDSNLDIRIVENIYYVKAVKQEEGELWRN